MSTPTTALEWITVNTPRESDRSARVAIERRGTGFVLHTEVTGQRGGKRTEEMGLTYAMGVAMLRQLNGTPNR